MSLKTWLENSPFTLSLSSGFFGFFAHTGFAKAHEEKGLHPKGYTGASAGAIVAGALAGGMPAIELEKIIISIQLIDFWDPKLGLGLLRGDKFEELLVKYFGSEFSQLKKPLHIATFNISTKKTETFTEGNLARAIRASCSLPLMFQPVRIGKQLYWDGGILDKMAIENLPKDENILSHYLPSKGITSFYEKIVPERKPNQNSNIRILSLENLPRSGPKKLHKGPEIIEQAYQQTLKLLSV